MTEQVGPIGADPVAETAITKQKEVWMHLNWDEVGTLEDLKMVMRVYFAGVHGGDSLKVKPEVIATEVPSRYHHMFITRVE